MLAGCLSDLSLVDFSIVNIQCLKIGSDELKAILDNTVYSIWNDNRTLKLLDDIKIGFWDDQTDLYVLLPLDFEKKFIEIDFYDCWKVLLLLFPSDLKIYATIDFQLFDSKYLWWNAIAEYDFRTSGKNIYDNYLRFEKRFLKEINQSSVKWVTDPFLIAWI